jgi:hypothetical protein
MYTRKTQLSTKSQTLRVIGRAFARKTADHIGRQTKMGHERSCRLHSFSKTGSVIQAPHLPQAVVATAL